MGVSSSISKVWLWVLKRAHERTQKVTAGWRRRGQNSITIHIPIEPLWKGGEKMTLNCSTKYVSLQSMSILEVFYFFFFRLISVFEGIIATYFHSPNLAMGQTESKTKLTIVGGAQHLVTQQSKLRLFFYFLLLVR